jgi:ubiquinone/menaquinone biosynthesis C-methylase UbiE
VRNREYYDEFAAWYEQERGQGYHQLIDDLEIELVERYGRGAAVLEAGCGTGLLLERTAGFAAEAWGFDLSAGMLGKARARGLSVVQGNLEHVPFPDERVDVVYSFKVLAHVEHIQAAIAELARVTRRGGYLLLEFYNPLSLRWLVKALKPATAISHKTTDEAVYTRYDGPAVTSPPAARSSPCAASASPPPSPTSTASPRSASSSRGWSECWPTPPCSGGSVDS